MRNKSSKAKSRTCLLCGTAVTPTAYEGLFLHAPEAGCGVRVTNHLGLSIDDLYEVVDGEIFTLSRSVEDVEVSAMAIAPMVIDGATAGDGGATTGFVSIDVASRRLFDNVGLPFPGGMSGLKGWSSISTFQACRYLWKQKYGIKTAVDESIPKSEALEVGSIVHLLLAVHYSRIIDPAYPLTVEDTISALRALLVVPAYLDKAVSYVQGYFVEYHDELDWMRPLAVEHLATDPITGVSCRWDIVFEIIKPHRGQLPGVYVCNTKTARDAGRVTMEQWKNDGQILGEIDLYRRLKYEKRWGKLRGACINLIIKTQVPAYRRSWIHPSDAVLRNHVHDRAVWLAEMAMAEATGLYPRSRASCVTKYGLCQLHDHCAGADAPREITL